MKKLFYFAIAALALAACTREEMAPEKEDVKNVPTVKVSFKAVLDQEDITKAEIDLTNGQSSWVKDDEIAVHTKNGKLATLKADKDGTSVTFNGEIEAGDEIEDGAIAFYPASIAMEGYNTKVNLPASYSSVADAARGFLLRGVLTGDAIEFKHIGAIVKVTVNDVPSNVEKLIFSSPSKVVTGELSVNASTLECGMGDDIAGSSICIATAAADRPTGACVFLMPMPVGTLTGGFSIILKDGSDNTVATKSTSSDVAISRAKLVKMKAFTPEGAASDWTIPGGFNSWSTTATVMTTVLGHDGWLVARNIDITPESGQTPGFKFFDGTNWKGGSMSALHTQYAADGDGNITYSNTSKYDIYYNPTTNRFFLANAGETWYTGKVIYLMTDMNLTDQPYYLHIWPNSGEGMNSTWPGIVGDGTETKSGIKYFKFPIAICDGNFAVNSYNCIFSDGKNPEDNPTVRYQFENGALTTDSVNDVYYASFTSSKYNGYVSGSTDSMTQFIDPAQPHGKSNWNLLLDRSTYKPMSWNDSPELVVKNVTIGPSTTLMFRYTQGSYSSNIFYFHDGSVDANSNFSVSFNPNGSRSSGPVFTVPSLTGNTLCDVYLDVINNKAKIVPIAQADANATLYFRLLDKSPEHAYLYAWQGGSTPSWENGDFPGQEMTTEVIDGIKYYKIALPISKVWDSGTKLIVSDGSWQTSDFTSADWSGRKDAYYFDVFGTTITQLSGKPEPVNIQIDGSFDDWDNTSIASKEYTGTLTKFKAYSDGVKLFIYQKYSGSTLDLSGWNYSNLLVDADNSNDTGETNWLGQGRDCDLEYYYYKHDGDGVLSNFDRIYFKTYDNTTHSWVTSSFDDSKVGWEARIDNSNNIEIEMSIPIGQLNIATNSVVRLGFIVRKPESTSQLNMLTVIIPKTNTE